jgi:ABC-2 type transport system ATP-binding protein
VRAISDVIRTESLCKRYRSLNSDALALRGLDLEVAPGEIFGYLGPNGAGKTTTLKLLMGLVRPSSGRAWILGRSVADPASRRDVGFMPEHPMFPHHLSCSELLRTCGRLSGLSRDEARHRCDVLLATTRLQGVADKRVRHLSKGMMQWLGLAQALVGNPQLLVLDEPMSGLDPAGRRCMRDLILEERSRGTTVFFSSHILADVEMICDRVGILMAGELVQCGRLDRILDRRSEGVEIRVADLPGVVAEQVRDLGGSTRLFGEETLIEVRGSGSVDRILECMWESRVRVRSLVPRRESLEEYFLRQIAGAGTTGSHRTGTEETSGQSPRRAPVGEFITQTADTGASRKGGK